LGFVDRILMLIKDRGITKNKMLMDLGLGKNSFVDWSKRGTSPSGETFIKIADYFEVSTDYLLGLSPNPTQKAEPSPRERMTREIEEILNALPEEKLPSVKALLLSVIDVTR